mmetsp:Transcript_9892/g.16433  ORF Transcript_9892/g.16433 Transcript_9892/m.16433 type:complete len:224 (-) Transcript_9892:128-799(-)
MEFSRQSIDQANLGSQFSNKKHQEEPSRTMNSTMEIAYATLGLPVFASLDEIKSQYRRLALTSHPDKVHGDVVAKKAAHDQFAKISAAYELLTSPELQHTTRSAVLYAPFSDPYQLFRQSFGEGMPINGLITMPRGISGYLMAAAPEPIKRTYEEISPPSSPITTATLHECDFAAPAFKRPKFQHAPPPPFLIRHSVKRDAWSVDPSSFDFVPSKRMRTSICT